MKKSFAAAMTVLVMLFAFIGTASAEGKSGGMYEAVNKELANLHYDYDKGSLTLKHETTVNLDKAVKKISTLKMAVAHFQTVRDEIFFTSHTEVVYYNPETGKIIPNKTAAKIKRAVDYKAQYEEELGENVKVTNVLILLFLILLIPAYFAFVWAKRRHSVLSYKLENNIMDGVGKNKYS
ncbi:MAG TPA: hypothetical protein VFK37_08970 [Bacillales bacterium]|nr:hypothetical protein [Bacillales bacterium]